MRNSFFTKISILLHRFRSDISGNFAIVFGLSILPIIMSVGMAIDYSKTFDSKAKLDSAADAAALSAVNAARNIISNTPNGFDSASMNATAISAGKAEGTRSFSANSRLVPFISNSISTVDVKIVGQSISSSVAYKADASLNFGASVGLDKIKLTNSVSAETTIPSYLDIYIVMDNSGSMGVGATQADIDLMISTPGLNCAFACHINGNSSYDTAHAAGANLRIDVVKNAIISLLSQAKALQGIHDQFRFSLFTFSNNLTTMQTATTDYNILNTALTQLSTDTLYGGTNFQYSIGQQLPSHLPISGNGKSPSERKTFIIIITDGVEDGVKFHSPYNADWYNDENFSPFYGNGAPSLYPPAGESDWHVKTYIQAVNPAICDNSKGTGAEVFILNVDYVSPPGVDERFNEIRDTITNRTDTTIKKCASNDGSFYRANSPTEIHNAVNTIFGQILKGAKLTQ